MLFAKLLSRTCTNQLFRCVTEHNLAFDLNVLSKNNNKLTTIRRMSTQTKKALVFLAAGAEEMETVITVDVLRRGQVEVTLTGVPDAKTPITCSRQVKICADTCICDLDKNGVFDLIVVPGGLGGNKILSECCEVRDLLKSQEKNNRFLAAVCAGPTTFKAHSIGKGKKMTCYPALKDQFQGDGYCYEDQDVVVDEKFITSKGPGTCVKFALTLLHQVVGLDMACKVAKELLVKY